MVGGALLFGVYSGEGGEVGVGTRMRHGHVTACLNRLTSIDGGGEDGGGGRAGGGHSTGEEAGTVNATGLQVGSFNEAG